MRFLTVLGLVLAVASNPLAQRHIETGFLDRQIYLDGQTYRYQVYVPPDYTPDQGWPVAMDLHSAAR